MQRKKSNVLKVSETIDLNAAFTQTIATELAIATFLDIVHPHNVDVSLANLETVLSVVMFQSFSVIESQYAATR